MCKGKWLILTSEGVAAAGTVAPDLGRSADSVQPQPREGVALYSPAGP